MKNINTLPKKPTSPTFPSFPCEPTKTPIKLKLPESVYPPFKWGQSSNKKY